jgi:transcription initiation factor TFIID subunit TAF12
VAGAVNFGASLARRRKGGPPTLTARDLAAYTERTYQLRVPGYSSEALRPYKRPAGSELHRLRASAVEAARREAADAAAAAEGGRGGAS